MTRAHKLSFRNTHTCTLDQCLSWYWKSKTDHLEMLPSNEKKEFIFQFTQ